MDESMLNICQIAALILVLATPAPGWAQAYPAKELLTTNTTVLGEVIRYPSTGAAFVKASVVTIEPGAETLFHRHPAPMFAYILEGEVTVDYGASGQRVYRKGDALMEAMHVPHRGMNLGTATVSILTVHMGAEGTANVTLEK
ncbi:MAG: cupin domain-containing protein [Candidatus Accumulibacter propinquus]